MDLSTIAGAAGGFLTNMMGPIMGYIGQQDTNRQNAAMADRQMEFQRDMSSTAFQRARADMEKAGLNPVSMAGSGGSSTPAGASIASQNPAQALEGVGPNMISSASQLIGLRNTMAQADKTLAETDLIEKTTPGKAANSALDVQKGGLYEKGWGILNKISDSILHAAPKAPKLLQGVDSGVGMQEQ